MAHEGVCSEPPDLHLFQLVGGDEWGWSQLTESGLSLSIGYAPHQEYLSGPGYRCSVITSLR